MISTLISLPYELARYPLAFVDDRLTGRLPDTLGNRVGWALGSADVLAGSLLRNPGIARRGADRVERSNQLLTAARLEEQAQARREEARAAEVSGFQEASRKRQAAQERAAKGLDEARAAEARGKEQAKERARQTAAEKKAAADQRATARTTAAEQRKQQVASVADAKQKNAQRRAKAELDDAREDQQVAQEAREDAERLSELTEAKKQERKRD